MFATTQKQYRLAVRRSAEKIEAFTDHYRLCAGVEGTMSEYYKLIGVKKKQSER